MRVLFDTNVVLDHLLAREPFIDPAERLLSLVDAREIEGVVCSTTVTTIHYLAGKELGPLEHPRYLSALLSARDAWIEHLDAVYCALLFMGHG